MTTLADLTSQLDKLRKARASGVSLVVNGESRIGYKTDAEMASAIADLERRIATFNTEPIRTVRISTSKGV
jgi:hypothetical protein